MIVTYKLEQHLKMICSENREYEDLLATWNINKRSYRDALKPITQNYPHYTDHGDSHSETILANIELLLGEEQIKKLSPTDTWLILQAAYLHDIGMSLLYNNVESEWETEEFQKHLHNLKDSQDSYLREAACYLLNIRENLQKQEFAKNWPLQVRKYVTVIISDYYRQKHGEISKDYINQLDDAWGIDLDFNGLIQNRLIKLLGKIAHLHTQNQDDVMELEYKSIGHNADYIHPRFVAEMIRMGDLLDVDNNRFDPYMYKVTGTLPDSSKNHIDKHKATRHILITPSVIEYKADCSVPAVYREARVFVSWLIKETDFLTKYWRDIVPENFSGSAPKLGKTELLLGGKPDLNGVADLRFNISQEKAFQIIEGTNLYNDKYIFIRELIQNAMDSCKLQMWRDLKNNKYHAWMKKEVDKNILPFEIEPQIYENYKVEISTRRISESMIEIKVSDNGTGISVEALKQMCDVGTSYWGRRELKKEIDNMPLWLKPTAGFGIGLQSVFLVTEQFEIISKSEGVEIKASVESRKKNGFVQISPSDTGRQQGTDIILTVSEEKLGGNYPARYDPFENNSRLTELKIKETLHENCASTYFPIILYQDEKEVETIQNISFEKVDKTWGKEQGYLYKFEEDCTSMQIWDTKNAILYHIKLSEIMEPIWNRAERYKLYFKGMKLSNRYPYIRHGLEVKMDIYGMDTKTSLALNRNELLLDAVIHIENLWEEIEKFYLQKLKELFNSIDEENFKTKWGGRSRYIQLYSYFALLNLEEKCYMKNHYFHRISKAEKTIDAYQINYEERKVERKQIKASELIKDINLVAYIQRVGMYYGDYDIESLLQQKLLKGEKGECKYVIPSMAEVSGFGAYGCKAVSILKGVMFLFYLDEKEHDKLYIGQEDENEFYSLIINREKEFYVGRRMVFPVLIDYKCITVQNYPDCIYGLGHKRMHNMILPFVDDDIAKMSEYENDKESYIRMIMDRDDFHNLSNYVYENQFISGKYTLQQIQETYKELISKCYDGYFANKENEPLAE